MIVEKTLFYMVKAGPTLTHHVSQTKPRLSKSDRMVVTGGVYPSGQESPHPDVDEI